MDRHELDKNFRIILQTAEELATIYTKDGWDGDCNDFTQASSSVSQELTNIEVERLWDEFANGELLAQDMLFTFHRKNGEKRIRIEQADKN